MKLLVITLLVAGICLAGAPDGGPRVGDTGAAPQTDDWTITITSVNDMTLGWVSGALRGCDYTDEYDELLVTDYSQDSVFSVDPTSGIKNYAMPVTPSVPDVLGICQYAGASENFLYVNDWNSVLDIYEYGTVSGWSLAFANPSAEPRGMDMDDMQTIWEIDADSHMLYHFDLTGTVLESFSLSQLPSGFACGCSVFPFGSDLGIVVGGYYYSDFYFYVFDGTTLEYIGSEPVPETASSSYGISYSANTDFFYWIYKDSGSNYKLCEFEVDFVETSLEQSTWGSIKTTF